MVRTEKFDRSAQRFRTDMSRIHPKSASRQLAQRRCPSRNAVLPAIIFHPAGQMDPSTLPEHMSGHRCGLHRGMREEGEVERKSRH